MGQQIQNYLQLTANGQVELTSAAVSALSPQTLAVAEAGITQVNDWIAQGAYEVSDVNGTMQIQQGPNFSAMMQSGLAIGQNAVSPNGIVKIGDGYWISLTESQTKTLITAINISGAVVGFLIGIAGAGILGDAVGAIASYLISLGAGELQTIDRNNGNVGLTIIYTPPASFYIF